MRDVTKDLIPEILTNLREKMTIDTQLQAYAAINESRASYLRTRVKTTLQSLENGATSEELATLMREDYASVQPRTSELHEDLQIFDTGLRRKNESGKKAIVWAMVQNDEQKQLAVRQTLKKMKPIGDPKLFGEMMRAIYAMAAGGSAYDTADRACALNDALFDWSENMVQEIRKSKFSDKNATSE